MASREKGNQNYNEKKGLVSHLLHSSSVCIINYIINYIYTIRMSSIVVNDMDQVLMTDEL